MTPSADFNPLQPGFDFLNGLMRSAGAALPGGGAWVTPTLDPQELDKRIQDLRTVQFWLEQNVRLIATTVQALEVQRLTLSTLQTMNLPLAELSRAWQVPSPPTAGEAGRTASAAPASPPARSPAFDFASSPAPAPAPTATATAPVPDAGGTGGAGAAAGPVAGAGAAAGSGSPLADPMQWWGALTQQFAAVAGEAMQAAAPGSASRLAREARPVAAAGAKTRASPTPKVAPKGTPEVKAKGALKGTPKPKPKAKAAASTRRAAPASAARRRPA